ncbi:MAG: hypothetical protein ACIAXF_05045 [Phycisphaerales bacterium JB063]
MVTLICQVVCTANAQPDALPPDDPTDALLEGYASTPTHLTELIDIEDAPHRGYDYAMDNAGANGKSCCRRRLVDEDDGGVFYRQAVSGGVIYTEVRDTFSFDGVCQETVFRRVAGHAVTTESAVVHEGALHIEKQGPDQPTQEEVVAEYSPNVEAVPLVWMELVFAYHVRMGHDRFYFRGLGDAMRASTSATVWLVDGLGTETIEVLGQEVEAHVFMVGTYHKIEGRPVQEPTPLDRRSLRYVLADGTIVRMVRRSDDRVDIVTGAISVEDAVALFAEADKADDETAPPAGVVAE